MKETATKYALPQNPWQLKTLALCLAVCAFFTLAFPFAVLGQEEKEQTSMLMELPPPVPGLTFESLPDDTQRVIFAYQGDVAYFWEDGLYGLMDWQGNILIEPFLWGVEAFVGNIAQVSLNHEEDYLIINRRGRLLFPPKDQQPFKGPLTQEKCENAPY